MRIIESIAVAVALATWVAIYCIFVPPTKNDSAVQLYYSLEKR